MHGFAFKFCPKCRSAYPGFQVGCIQNIGRLPDFLSSLPIIQVCTYCIKILFQIYGLFCFIFSYASLFYVSSIGHTKLRTYFTKISICWVIGFQMISFHMFHHLHLVIASFVTQFTLKFMLGPIFQVGESSFTECGVS